MNQTDIDRLQQQLLALQTELRSQEASTQAESEPVELDQARVGRLSRMDALQTQQMALETSRRRQGQLQKIEGALRRIESGDFGDCFVCGEEIDLRRLDVDPTNTRCIRCAET
ncbi:MAG: TraR/DksA family transcriptional regulator [Gammaproteobacteria bacterium]